MQRCYLAARMSTNNRSRGSLKVQPPSKTQSAPYRNPRARRPSSIQAEAGLSGETLVEHKANSPSQSFLLATAARGEVAMYSRILLLL